MNDWKLSLLEINYGEYQINVSWPDGKRRKLAVIYGTKEETATMAAAWAVWVVSREATVIPS